MEAPGVPQRLHRGATLDSGTVAKMSHTRLKSDTASEISWGEQTGPGSRPVASEDFRESPQPQQASTPGRLQTSKETLSSPTPSAILSHVPDFQQESQLFTDLPLDEIEKIFEDSEYSTAALDMKAFIKAMKKNLNNVSDETLEALFLKVDIDCNGFITWPNYVDYMIREFQGKELMRKSQYPLSFHLPMRVVPLNHGCEVVKVDFLIQRFKKVGHFLTVTKDGILQFWSEYFSLVSSFRLNQVLPLHNQQMWVMDMACLYNTNLVAIASSDQKIEFFDISNCQCARAFTFIDLDSCVVVMDYWSDYHRGVFCFGDTKGNITVFTSDNVASGLFNPRILPRTSKWDHWISVSTQKLLNEKSALHRSYRLKALHSNWCQQVKFISQMNLVVSCSATEKSSLVLTVLPSKVSKNPKCSVLNLRKGILCFDYCLDKNFLVTGGYDSVIRLWNPFFSQKPVWLMKGHQTSVTHVLVNDRNGSTLFSISQDKNIRVWDMQDYVCLQSFCGKLLSLGNCPITSAYFHKDDNTLICSTFSIGILRGNMETHGPGKPGENTTYGAPLCAVLYSKIFRQVVSGCLSGMVSAWDILTGKRMMEFSVTGDQQVELTAMSLDESERCLLTGLRDGTLKMWNYSTGKCLLSFPNPDKLEISGIIHMNKVLYVTGWSKRITYYVFHAATAVPSCRHWQTFHTEDVLSMAKYQNQFLGTSSYNGDILFWNVNVFKPILKFNASDGPLPLLLKKVLQEGDNCSVKSHRPGKPVVEQKWALKTSKWPLSPSAKTVANANLRQNLASAPPVMRHPRDKEPDGPMPLQNSLSASSPKLLRMVCDGQSFPQEAERSKEELQKKMLLQSNASVEKIIFLQSRPRLPHTAVLLSSCMDGYIYAWSIHGSGGLLGKFPADLQDNSDVVVGAMATDENDWILVTGDCKGYIKIWDIEDYCTFANGQSSQPSGINKFRLLILKSSQISLPDYTPLEEKEVVAGQTISLVPPTLLIAWKGHLDSVSDILYVNSIQLVISAGQDRNVKAWKLSGTFGLSLWKRLEDAHMVGDGELHKSLKKEDGSIGVSEKAHPEMQKEPGFAEALEYQRREQVALMALLNGKADTEAEAWAKLQKITLSCPWAGERSPEAIEKSWYKWESKDKQMSNVVGAAFKPKERSWSPEHPSTNVHYGWMKHQISPQIYQGLHFNKLAPTHKPDIVLHKVRDPRGRLNRLVARCLRKDLDPDRKTRTSATPSSTSPLLPPSALGSRLLASTPSSFSSPSRSASTAQSAPLVLSQASRYILRREATPVPLLPR